MNEFYIFNIKPEFYKIYKNRTGELFYILNRIYNMKKIEKDYGYNLFCQICNFYNKNDINSKIKKQLKKDIMYSNNDYEHVINNLFLGEISILTIKYSVIKVETNIDKSSFIDILKNTTNNLFLCNFNTMEYFFLSNSKLKI